MAADQLKGCIAEDGMAMAKEGVLSIDPRAAGAGHDSERRRKMVRPLKPHRQATATGAARHNRQLFDKAVKQHE
jgi:hypothetical protein